MTNEEKIADLKKTGWIVSTAINLAEEADSRGDIAKSIELENQAVEYLKGLVERWRANSENRN